MQNPARRLQKLLLRSRITLFSFALPLLAFSLLHFGGSILRIVYVLLGFSLIIFFHELGHFAVARMCSVKCEAFSLGIGPRMLGWRKGVGLSFGKEPTTVDTTANEAVESAIEGDIQQTGVTFKDKTNRLKEFEGKELGECDYRISWLPLGGYVRMLGQDDMDPTKVSTDPHAFNQRPIWQRMCIVSAGVIMNIIFAVVAFSIIFRTSGVNFPTADIGFASYGLPADGKLQLGDKIVAIDGKGPRDGAFIEYTDLIIASALSSGNDEIKFDYIRDGKPGVAMIKPVRIPGEPFLMIGVSQMPSLVVANQESIDENQKFHAKAETDGGLGDAKGAEEVAKLHPGDLITAFNGQPVSNYRELYDKVQANGSKPIELAIHDPKGQHVDQTITITPRLQFQQGVSDFPEFFGMTPRTRVNSVQKPERTLYIIPGSPVPAAQAGIKPGDEILSVNSRRWPTVEQFRDIITSNPGKEIDITVLRDGQEVPLKVTPSKKGLIGVSLGYANDDLAVINRAGGSGPLAGHFGPDDEFKIVTVDDKPVKNWQEVREIVKSKKAGEQIAFTFLPIISTTTTQPATQASPIAVTFTVDEDLAKAYARQTHYMLNLPVTFTQQLARANNFYDAAMMGLEHTKKFIGQVYMTLYGLVHRTVPPDNLHGIVGIGYIGYQVQERGMSWFWYLMAMISVNLAVANFLPLPIVDGGLFLLLILEKIRGKPLSLKVQSAIQVVGIVLLAGMFLFVTYNDLQLFK